MIKVFTIILNYNNYKDTKECLDSLINLKICDFIDNHIVVVDNKSLDGSGQKIFDEYKSQITYLQSKENYGYAVGNNIGIKFALENKADYICILNNDTVVTMDFYTECITYLKENLKVGFIGPVIEEYKCNKVQSSGGRISFINGCTYPLHNGDNKEDLPKVIDCDCVFGACMLFSSSLIEKIGLIPENYFLFFEETEWCLKSKRQNLRNVCLTSSYIKHKGSATILEIGGLCGYMGDRNRIVFLKRNCSNKILLIISICFVFAKNLGKSILKDKAYWSHFAYMVDGLFNRFDLKKYPFIKIRSDK